MAPPKRSPTDLSTTTAANNFFTRGKKPTTIQRIVTAKKAAVSAPAPAVVKKVHHHSDEDEEDEVSDEIEHADTDEDEDVQLHTSLPPSSVQQVDEDEEDRVVDEYDSLNEEIEQSDEDSDTVMATTTGRTTRSSGGKAGTGTKKKSALDPITRPAAAKISKPSLPTRSSAEGKNKAPYVAPNVGDIHSGCKLPSLLSLLCSIFFICFSIDISSRLGNTNWLSSRRD